MSSQVAALHERAPQQRAAWRMWWLLHSWPRTGPQAVHPAHSTLHPKPLNQHHWILLDNLHCHPTPKTLAKSLCGPSDQHSLPHLYYEHQEDVWWPGPEQVLPRHTVLGQPSICQLLSPPLKHPFGTGSTLLQVLLQHHQPVAMNKQTVPSQGDSHTPSPVHFLPQVTVLFFYLCARLWGPKMPHQHLSVPAAWIPLAIPTQTTYCQLWGTTGSISPKDILATMCV